VGTGPVRNMCFCFGKSGAIDYSIGTVMMTKLR
jgi:hypothetical protein